MKHDTIIIDITAPSGVGKTLLSKAFSSFLHKHGIKDVTVKGDGCEILYKESDAAETNLEILAKRKVSVEIHELLPKHRKLEVK